MKFSRRRASIVIAVTMALGLTACGGSSSDSGATASGSSSGSGGYGYKFAVVTHGGVGDSFWSIVKAGAQHGGKDEGVSVSYQSDGDPQKQGQLIDAAVNQKVDGLVVSMANPDALAAPIKRAVAAGIPVITINSGQSRSSKFGALAHVGQDETVAGTAVGQRLKTTGVKKLLCVIQEAGNVGLEQRCAGAEAGLGGTTENIQVDNNDLQGAEATIKAKLQQDPSIDGVLTLGGQVAAVAETAIVQTGSKATLATFDLSVDVAQAVESGKIAFAVDQQPYVQGYLPIVMLTLYKSNGNTLGGGQPVLTGPSFVTKENAGAILALARAGTR
ncbi:sugar ABC transporter substrate-binding protein [Frankia sp. Cas4]|uniref:sugar ABC transporter substrate-binding protein n=1 Tax=Frankia sp. Cas4 TaxID=3073927 RepID=UPI003A0FE323